MLVPLIKSKRHPYRNLAQAIFLQESLHHIRFVLDQHDLMQENTIPITYPSHVAKLAGPGNEELLSPMKQVELDSAELTLLKKYYATMEIRRGF